MSRYFLASVYAFRGEKEKAYENLRIFNQAEEFRYPLVLLMKRDELFESIRNEPEFQQILLDIETNRTLVSRTNVRLVFIQPVFHRTI